MASVNRRLHSSARARPDERNGDFATTDPDATSLPRTNKVSHRFDNHVRTCRELTPISLDDKPHRLAFQLTASRRRFRPYRECLTGPEPLVHQFGLCNPQRIWATVTSGCIKECFPAVRCRNIVTILITSTTPRCGFRFGLARFADNPDFAPRTSLQESFLA